MTSKRSTSQRLFKKLKSLVIAGVSPPRWAPGEAAYAQEVLSPWLKRSLAVHGALLFVMLVKGLVFPDTSIPIPPTLRVDIVALPDILKKDKSQLIKVPTDQEIAQPKPSKEKPVEKAEKDEMVLHPKVEKKDTSVAKRNQRSLERIKALAKIQEDEEPPKKQVPIKGNMLSKGSSLSGDAREAGEPTYLDTIRDRLQEYWELNPYLARQKLTAQVRIFIDPSGRVRSFSFVRSSGNAQFDQSVERTIKNAQPFPKPARGSAADLLVNGVVVGFPL